MNVWVSEVTVQGQISVGHQQRRHEDYYFVLGHRKYIRSTKIPRGLAVTPTLGVEITKKKIMELVTDDCGDFCAIIQMHNLCLMGQILPRQANPSMLLSTLLGVLRHCKTAWYKKGCATLPTKLETKN